jgi:hypothetical protein
MGSTTTSEPRTAPDLAETLRLKIQLWLAIVFMALAFGAGMTIGVLSGHSGSTAVIAPTSQVPSNFGVAPPLTDQQLQGGLPAGHPEVGSGQGSSGGGSEQSGS